ncbi:hypothetical protein AYO46_01065 [Betaproteobacteria bacterium SCGC AG-212-J23]|nr:hypothetical protein AYO46_01065 [Betaproteobacteria bacterium SCGC AG-212-J23]
MKILPFVLFASFAFADTPPVPKVFKGMQGQKGQYQVEMLEAAGKSSARKMTICTDNLMKPHAEGKGRSEVSCKYKLLKDTADEAMIESTCNERTSTVTLKRENAKSILMSMQSTGPRGASNMKARYTYLGACREGQGTMSLDPDSPECKQMKAQAAQMDAKTRERLLAMCK